MKAAIYARKSTEQNGVADEVRSVTRQVDHARGYASRKGWTILDEHIYVDDGISGAEFERRPGFLRLMNAVQPSPPFEALIMSESSRLGRETFQTGYALKQLLSAGVRVFFYQEDRECSFKNPTDKLLFAVLEGIDDMERARASQRVTDAMKRKFEAGHVTGCKPFGYYNERLGKSHVEWRINEAEAAIVREIYARFAAGQGHRSIAKALNAAGVAKPRAQQGRTDGWSVGTIRAVLGRPLYRGEVLYNTSRKRDDWGKKQQRPRPEPEWMRRDAPELRIVDPDLAARVDRLRANRRERYLDSLQRTDGRMPEKAHGRYLLSGGMLICPSCSGHFEARKAPWKGTREVYICSTTRRKPGVCSCTLALPIAQTDEAILSVIEGEVLHPEVVDQLVAMLDTSRGDDVAALNRERDRLADEVKRLVDSIAAGVPAETVAAAIRERERAVRSIEARLRAPRETPDAERLRAALRHKAADWKAELRKPDNLAVARLVLRRLIGPLTLCADPRPAFIARWEARTTTGSLLDGLTNWVASPTGFEPVLPA